MPSIPKSIHASGTQPKMIDVSEKPVIRREATAEGTIFLESRTLRLIAGGKIEKGDPFQIATIGAIQAVKSTPQWMMMCHPIPVESTSVEINQAKDSVRVRVTVIAFSKTGVEMEALNGVAAALLNIWDVVKKYEKDSDGQYPLTRISNIRVVEKVKGVRG